MAVPIASDVIARLDRLELPFNRYGLDPYGVGRKELFRYFTLLGALYRHYFRVTAGGLEHVQRRGRLMLVGNHSGGVALDASIVTAVMFFELEPPRLAQAMAEKFISRLPFAATWMNRCGHFVGLPEHAVRLLEDERLLLVFPEGARGTAKLYVERYSLVDFGTGFMRLALQTRTPIVPFAFFGGGEAIPTVFNAYGIGKLLGAPYLPVTPYLFPVPLPARLHVEFSPAMEFEGSGAEEDEVIEGYVAEVKARIAGLIEAGRGAFTGAPRLGEGRSS